MPNYITDASHEFGSPAWEEAAGADRLNDPAKAKIGSWCMGSQGRWQGIVPPPGYVHQGRFQQQFTTPDDKLVRKLRYSIRLDDDAIERWESRVLLYAGHHPIEGPHPGQLYFKQWFNDDMTGAWEDEVSLPLVSADGKYTILVYWVERFRELELDPISSMVKVLFDAWAFNTDDEQDVAIKRQEIRDAVVTAIQRVTMVNGHSLDVGEVGTTYQRKDKIVDWPAVQVVYGEEERAHNELHRKRSELLLHAVCWCKGQGDTFTPEQEADELSAAVEQEVELHTGGQYLGLGYVDNVTLEGISPFETDEDMTGGTRLYILDIRVVYRYERGSP